MKSKLLLQPVVAGGHNANKGSTLANSEVQENQIDSLVVTVTWCWIDVETPRTSCRYYLGFPVNVMYYGATTKKTRTHRQSNTRLTCATAAMQPLSFSHMIRITFSSCSSHIYSNDVASSSPGTFTEQIANSPAPTTSPLL